MLLRLLRTLGRLASSNGSQQPGVVAKSGYNILWFSFMITSEWSYRWLCMIRTIF